MKDCSFSGLLGEGHDTILIKLDELKIAKHFQFSNGLKKSGAQLFLLSLFFNLEHSARDTRGFRSTNTNYYI